jgi:hypothetical protein
MSQVNDTSVQVAPDSTGKAIDNTTVPTGAGTVYRQTVSIGDPSSRDRAPVDPINGLATTDGGYGRRADQMHSVEIMQMVAGPSGFVPFELPSIGA